MESKKILFLESTVFVISIALIGLLILSHQSILTAFIDECIGQVREVTNVMNDSFAHH